MKPRTLHITFNKRLWRTLALWTIGASLVVGLFWLVRHAERQRLATVCSGHDITVQRKGNVYLQTPDVERWLDKSACQWRQGTLKELNPSLIEYLLNENPYVKSAQVYFTTNAKMHVEVEQKEPYMRIYAPHAFYIDENGKPLPVNTNYPCRLRVCTMEGKATPERLAQVYNLERLLRGDSLLNALIDQVHLDAKQEFELTPKVGQQKIVLGNFDRMEEKLSNVVLFYHKGMPQCGWDKYAVLNVKYKGQIVAVKP